MRVRDPEQTRARLVAAGLAVAGDVGLSQMTIASVLQSAGASRGAFFHHFPDREAFVLSIHEDFHHRLLTNLQVVRAAHPAGRERLLALVRGYWRFCLGERSTRALLLQARGEGRIASASRRRSAEIARLAVEDLTAMGAADPTHVAPLIVAMATEVALLEHEAGKSLPANRRAFNIMLPKANV